MSIPIPNVSGKIMVVGFLFSSDRRWVVLIRKNKPIWQKGLLNGVGGKVEPGEDPAFTMEREWREETKASYSATDWRLFCELTHGNNYVFFFEMCYRWTVHSLHFPKVPENEEQVNWYGVENILANREKSIRNLKWLLPLAMDSDLVTVKALDLSQVQC
jgi:8-oxo-dGTP diphosphatase